MQHSLQGAPYHVHFEESTTPVSNVSSGFSYSLLASVSLALYPQWPGWAIWLLILGTEGDPYGVVQNDHATLSSTATAAFVILSIIEGYPGRLTLWPSSRPHVSTAMSYPYVARLSECIIPTMKCGS